MESSPRTSIQPEVTVIIPNYNGMEHLKDCLDSLSNLDYPDEKLNTLIVDNGSSDGSVEYLKSEYSEVNILELPENTGFAKAINLGVDKAETEYVAFLNNDMKADELWLKNLVQALNPHEKVFCASSEILDWDGNLVDFSGGRLNFCGYGISLRRGEPAEKSESSTENESTLFPCGGSMIIQKRLFIESGGFDKEYFAYYEDVDLGLRLWMNGFPTVLAKNSKVFHRGFGTGKRMDVADRHFLWHRNALFTIFKNFEDVTLKKTFSSILFMAIDRGLNYLTKNNSSKELIQIVQTKENTDSITDEQKDSIAIGYAQLRAVSEFLHSLPELIPRRMEIQKNRKLSDDNIFIENRLTLDFSDMVDLPRYDIFHSKLIKYFNIDALFDSGEVNKFNLSTLQKLDSYLTDQLVHIRNLEKQNKSLVKSLAMKEAEYSVLKKREESLETAVNKQQEYIASLQLFESKVKSSLLYRLYKRIKDAAPSTNN